MSLASSIAAILLENISTTLIFLMVLFIAWMLLQKHPSNLPPMPSGNIPLLGHIKIVNLFSMGEKKIWEASKQLGSSIITLTLGGRYFIFMHTYEEMKECFSREDFAGREPVFKGLLFNGLVTEGPRWKEQRRFALSALRDLGLGKNRMEQQMQEECAQFIPALENYRGNAVEPTIMLNTAMSNVICSMVFGHRFDYADKTFNRLMEIINENFSKNMRRVVFSTVTPLANYMPGDIFRIKRFKANIEEVKEKILKPEFERHLRQYDPNNIEDFIDAFIYEMKLHESSAEQHWFNENQLMWNIDDLFNTGTETTSTTLRWALLCMLHYPEVQAKIHEEIHNVIGTERMPSMSDKRDLPYTEATLNEIQRMCIITPIGAFHMASETAEFRGYTIPKDASITANFYAIHHDPDHWKDPMTFNPDRFIGPDGKFQKDDHVITFSVGKHSCLGESLARMELFMFFTSILQKFRVQVPEGVPLPSMEPQPGVTAGPKPYKICFIKDD